MTGSDALLDALVAQGVEVIFGNPGSTELPLMDALAAPGRPRFVLGLTEPVVMGMADGYAQASGRLGVALVHVQPGMANAMSGVLNAARARVPLLVIVGQQLSSMLPGAPFLGGDVIGMARPLARYAEEVTHPSLLGSMLVDAVRAAFGPPAGPAVLSIPLEAQAGAGDPLPALPTGPQRLDPPDAAELGRAAALLAGAASPVILAGDGVAHDHAHAELSSLAARLGAPVMGEPFAALMPLDTDDPAWAGPMPRAAAPIRQALAGHDVVLAVGMPVFRLFGWSPGSPMPGGARLIHVDVDPEEIGRMIAPDVGIVAEPGDALRGLLALLGGDGSGLGGDGDAAGESSPPESALEAAAARHATLATAHEAARANARAELRARADGAEVITPAALSAALGEGVALADLVVDEGITSTRDLRVALGDRDVGSCMWHRGSALGWGLPAAVGGAIADPTRRVVCAQGDGSLMFGVHALWTAAHERCRLALIVADNSSYEILRAGMEGLTGTPQGGWPGLDVTDPPLDIAGICRGFGASAESVTDPADLPAAIGDMLARAEHGPAVLVARVEGLTPAVGGPLDGALG
ncbi:MAG: thiamine pyrophosphate-binding protein [Actinomycetota bacterium]